MSKVTLPNIFVSNLKAVALKMASGMGTGCAGKIRLSDLEDKSQGQGSLHATHPLMPVISHGKYRRNPSITVHAVERTRQDVSHFSSLNAKSGLVDLEDIGQGHRSLHATHPLMLVIICAQYEKNPSRSVDARERTRKLTDGQTDGQTDRQTDRRTG